MSPEYWTPYSAAREVVWWTVTARAALDEWEPLVAGNVRADGQLSGPEKWQAQRWHHAAVVALAHVYTAGDLMDPPLEVDAALRAEVKAGRDLLEHWDENRPVFQRRPRTQTAPRPSGRGFAERHPLNGPYFALGWSGRQGPTLLPGVPSATVHDLLDGALARALEVNPGLAEYVLERPPSPWLETPEEWRWWPK